jgi:hypothetical protein
MTSDREQRWQQNTSKPLSFPKISLKELMRGQPRWNIGQLLVWIATNDPGAVAAASEARDPEKAGDFYEGIPWAAVAALILEDRSLREQEKPGEWINAAIAVLRSGRIYSFGRVNKQPSHQFEGFEWDQFYIHLGHDWYPSVKWRGTDAGPIEEISFDAQSILNECPVMRKSVDRKKRGPFPSKRERVKNEMRDDIKNGKRSVESLQKAKEQCLANYYSVSRETVRAARNEVLSELQGP